jgi:LPXTG-motif cell wall-anchored protein
VEITPPVEPSSPAQPTSPSEPSSPSESPSQSEPAPPSSSAPSGEVTASARPDLSITASAEDRSYLIGEKVPLKVRITNNGAGEAKAVKLTSYTASGSYFSLDYNSMGDLLPWGPGATIAPGATKVADVWGSVNNLDRGDPVFDLSVQNKLDMNLSDNVYRMSVAITRPTPTGSAAGIVFGDANKNGVHDSGEGLGGVNVALYAGGLEPFKAVTDADGTFRFTGLPLRTYSIYYSEVPGGWVIPYSNDSISIDGSDKASNLLARAERPLSDVLHAKVEFTERTYAPGATARMKVTLTNTGSVALSRIHAFCDRAGEGPHEHDPWNAPSWGDLHYSGPGVTVEPGQTRTFEAIGTVPDNAGEYGYVYVACDFGPDEPDIQGHPTAFDRAGVPGANADFHGRIFHDRNDDQTINDGEDVTGTKVGLVDLGTGQVLASTVTDATGRFEFDNMPAGLYELRVFGPWTWYGGEQVYTNIGTCTFCGYERYFRVVPGSDQPDSDVVGPVPPTALPDLTPAAEVKQVAEVNTAASSTDELASTGASVIGLSVAGLLALVAGAGALLITRRRRDIA